MAKLLVLAGALCQASSGETFLPGQGQIAGLRDEQARWGSSAPKRTGMRCPSVIEVEVTVIQEGAASAALASAKNEMPSPAAILRMLCLLCDVAASLAGGRGGAKGLAPGLCAN